MVVIKICLNITYIASTIIKFFIFTINDVYKVLEQ